MTRAAEASPDPSEQACALYRQGLSLQAVGRLVGKDASTVRRWLVEGGVAVRPRGGDRGGPKRRDLGPLIAPVRVLYLGGMRIEAIAEHIGESYPLVKRVLNMDGGSAARQVIRYWPSATSGTPMGGLDEQRRPCAAMIDNFLLDASRNAEVDRRAAQAAVAAMPGLARAVAARRRFLERALAYLIGLGVRQFVDLGSGIPDPCLWPTHTRVHDVDPAARIVYVDHDPLVAADGQWLLAGQPNAAMVGADVRDLDTVLSTAPAADLLDLAQPAAVLLIGAEFLPDPGRLLSYLDDVLVSGSVVVFSHAVASAHAARAWHTLYGATPTPVRLRTRADLRRRWNAFGPARTALVDIDGCLPDMADPDVEPHRTPRATPSLAGVTHR
jgi:transposase